jgi:hypothetical protein
VLQTRFPVFWKAVELANPVTRLRNHTMRESPYSYLGHLRYACGAILFGGIYLAFAESLSNQSFPDESRLNLQ